jgi:[ribosomal protein S5]-alanine N-acetyltransferase
MQIATPRLLLREYDAGDLPALLAYHNDPRSREYYGPDEGHPAHVRELLALFRLWAAEVPRQNYQLALALREAPSTVIGSGGLRQAGQAAGEAELGLEVAPAYWGQGYGMEAARALLAFGFTALGIRAVRGITVSANTRVAHLLRRLGFQSIEVAAGPAWYAARGFQQTTWELTRAQWAAGEVR